MFPPREPQMTQKVPAQPRKERHSYKERQSDRNLQRPEKPSLIASHGDVANASTISVNLTSSSTGMLSRKL